MDKRRAPIIAIPALVSCALLCACATPVFRDVDHAVEVTASDIQQNSDAYRGAEVVWGGRIVAIENRTETTEVEVVAYPLDRDQQPMPEAPSQGRFMLVLPGFVEPLDYAAGRHLTVHGVLAGTRVGHVQERAYLYPMVRAMDVKVWPWGFIFDKKPRISIGIGARIH